MLDTVKFLTACGLMDSEFFPTRDVMKINLLALKGMHDM
jgi:hypothetical protein